MTWTVCTWDETYWHLPSEGWRPVLSGLTLCGAMQVVENLESRGWDREVSIWVHSYKAVEFAGVAPRAKKQKKQATLFEA